MKHYTHLAIEDKSKAVERLPIFDGGFGTEADKKTGTDCADVCGVLGGVNNGTKSGVSGGVSPQAPHVSDRLKDATSQEVEDAKPSLNATSEAFYGLACPSMSQCPGEDSNLHSPKRTSPSSYQASPAKDNENNDLGQEKNIGMPKSMPCEHENDTDLANLIESWPSLPDHIKQTIRTLIDSFMEYRK
ncbi:hypothetical protein ACFL6U_07015 [Planctomycetota bacterium]